MNFFRKRRVKGAVSIFLVIILIPTMLLSAVLIDGARMQSARAMTQEAADLAAASALAAYNVDLKETYGLFAIADKDDVESIYKESLSATLMASGITDDADYADRIWELLKIQAGLGNPYKGQSFLNLYDFQVDEAAVTPMYSLANTAVLENQMVEYAKYRGVYIAADRMELISKFNEMKKQAQENAEASDAIEDRMKVDEKDKAEAEIVKLNGELQTLNALMAGIASKEKQVFACFEARMKELRIEAAGADETMTGEEQRRANDLDRIKRDFANALHEAVKQAKNTAKQAETARKETEKTIDRLEEFVQRNREKSGNETIRELVADAEQEIAEYRDKYLANLKRAEEDPLLNKLKEDGSLKTDMERLLRDITEAIEAYQEELEAMEEQEDSEGGGDGEKAAGEDEEEEEIEYFYYFLLSSACTTDARDVLYQRGSGKYRWECGRRLEYMQNAFPPGSDAMVSGREHFLSLRVPLLGEGEEKTKSDTFKQKAKENDGADADKRISNESVSRGTVPGGIYDSRPSKTFNAASEAASYGGLVGGDVQVIENEPLPDGASYYREGNLDGARSAIKGASSSLLLDLGEMARDDALVLSYLFGTFKTRLTGDPKFTSSGGASVYMPKWRIREGGETDIRFQPKKDRKTVLRGEIEYLVYGLNSDRGNEDAVYATIMAERLANNMIALYRNETIKGICKTASRAAALASVVVPSPVWFWIFLTAWAVAETYMDMHYLVQEGYRIPLFKAKDNLLLTDFDMFLNEEGAVGNYGDPDDGIFVTYEDYLLILLLIKGRTKRVMRAADLIEMNMRQGQSDFRMSEAFTCLRAGTSLSIRYLFGTAGPFGAEYGKNGLTGRMRFENTIYQSY